MLRPPRRPIFRIPNALCWLGVASFALAAPACVSVSWRDRALRERPDLETPEKTFETLRAALRLDDPILAYRTLSEAMKEREKFTLFEFTAGWDAFFRRYPYARLIGNADLDKLERTGDLAAVGWASAYGHTMRVDFRRQTFFEVRLRDGNKFDGFLGDDLRQHLGKAQNREDVLRGILVDKSFESVNVEDITSFQIAIEWKVLGFTEITGADTKPQDSPTDRSTKDP